MLVAFGGLPGTGKTTIARAVARRRRATYLRIDSIEQAMKSAGIPADGVGPAGYLAAYALAETNLELGRTVIADSVNPLSVTRIAWRAVAANSKAPLIEVEVVCSDPAEHRRRVEGRSVDVPNLISPTWASVLRHNYEPWTEPRLVIDTAVMSAEDAVAAVCLAMNGRKESDR